MSDVTINITRTDVVRSGTAKRTGRPYTLYQVHGTYADGAEVTDVRTFDTLGVGPQALVLAPEERGNGYIARKPRTATVAHGGDGPDIARLESRIRRLERQMQAIIDNAEIPLP